MSRKALQKKRIMKYFIDASLKIIEEDGFDNVTIRKVAELAGYNSATLYNYFENLDHLLFYSSMKYLRNYLLRLKDMDSEENKLDRYYSIWRCFAEEAFSNPMYYYQIFYTEYDMSFNDAVKQYYEIYPEELENLSEELLPMLTESDLYKRDLEVLSDCVKAGIIMKEDLKPINNMVVLIFQGFILRAKAGNYSKEELAYNVDLFMDYLRRIFKSHLI